MAFISRKFSAGKALTAGLGLCAALLLASCGGGGGSGGTNGSSGSSSSGSTPTVALSVVTPSSSSISLAAYASTSLTVKVSSANGAASTSPVAVTFTSPCATSGKATLPASATTSNGEVTVTYVDNGCSATDVITIGTTGANSITETIGVAAPVAASVEFVSAVPSTESIVIAGSGGSGRVETATLTYEVLDTEGNPLPNQTVNFSLVPAGVVTLQTLSGTTDASGKVVASVTSLSQQTTFRVIATLSGGQSTMSDTITVTTGQTNPTSLSLSVTTFTVEGWNYDDMPDTVNVLLADSNGNPVADGTPVVASTDSGAIGTSAIGGCTTVNGACALAFRSQNPRYGVGQLPVPSDKRAGLATVTVSTSTANQALPISGQIGIFLSGSYAATAVPVADTTNTILIPAGSVAWYTVKVPDCNADSFAFQLNDVNNNPMPAQSTLKVTAASTGVDVNNNPNPALNFGQIFPATVPDTTYETLNPKLMRTYEGSYHTVSFSPPSNCAAGGTYPVDKAGDPVPNGEMDILVTSPKTVQSVVKLYIWYPE